MREFGKDYLFKVSVEPDNGYGHWQSRKKPFYVVAANKTEAASRVNLKQGWKIKSTSLLAEQYSGVLFGSNN
jgi:hypothetical protein